MELAHGLNVLERNFPDVLFPQVLLCGTDRLLSSYAWERCSVGSNRVFSWATSSDKDVFGGEYIMWPTLSHSEEFI